MQKKKGMDTKKFLLEYDVMVRSTLPQNFCLRSAPHAFVWPEASFEHFGPTELHSEASE